MTTQPVVLVTGAGGLIGRHVVRALRQLQAIRVVGVARQWMGGNEVTGETVVVDLADGGSVEAMRRIAPDVIVHAAAVLPKTLDDQEAAHANEIIDRHVLGFAASCGARVIFISSISVYSDSVPPWSETSAIGSLPTYAAAKLETERRVLGLAVPSAALRLSSPYGATGHERSGVLLHFVRQAVAGGELFVSGLGSRAQDFVHAHDVGRAVQVIVRGWLGGGSLGSERVFNIGSGVPVTMKALAEKVVQVCGAGRVVLSGKPSQDDTYRAELLVGRAKDVLGWAPAVSLEAGIAQLARRMRGGDEDWLSI